MGKTTCSLRKIFTKVVFELTARGRVVCQMSGRFGSGSVCVPGDRLQVLLGAGTGPVEKGAGRCRPSVMGTGGRGQGRTLISETVGLESGSLTWGGTFPGLVCLSFSERGT